MSSNPRENPRQRLGSGDKLDQFVFIAHIVGTNKTLSCTKAAQIKVDRFLWNSGQTEYFPGKIYVVSVLLRVVKIGCDCENVLLICSDVF